MKSWFLYDYLERIGGTEGYWVSLAQSDSVGARDVSAAADGLHESLLEPVHLKPTDFYCQKDSKSTGAVGRNVILRRPGMALSTT